MTITLRTLPANSSVAIIADFGAMELGVHPQSYLLDDDYSFTREQVVTSKDLKALIDAGRCYLDIGGEIIDASNSNDELQDFSAFNPTKWIACVEDLKNTINSGNTFVPSDNLLVTKCEETTFAQSDWVLFGLKYEITYTYIAITNLEEPNEIQIFDSLGNTVQVDSRFDNTAQTFTITVNAIPDCRFDGRLLILGK